ncbi:MAG: hypothetical protein PHE28_02895 [Bacteroidales bacterium]|jgi:hypothetical protein|nr:hypothetical protein [Bacteroidales bacterium]MDX9797669.1 hypothetical protein [Bacteroidales bacterium]
MKRLAFYSILLSLSVFIYSCGGDDDPNPTKPATNVTSISRTNVALKVGETVDVAIKNYDTVVYVNNSNIATIEKIDSLNYRIVGRKVGKTFIDLKTVKCNITVNRYYAYFRDPSLSWGEGKNVVKAYELRTLKADDPSSILYQENNSVCLKYVNYVFTDYKLSNIEMYFLPDKTIELNNYLNDYYIQSSQIDPDYDLFESPLPKTDPSFFNVKVKKTPVNFNNVDYILVTLSNPIYN